MNSNCSLIALISFQGDWSLYVEQLTLEQVQSEVMEVLRTMYPNITLPKPVAIHTSTWATSPLYRGSYVNQGPSYVPGHSQNLKATVNNRLWFAGEATSVAHFGPSRMQTSRHTRNVFFAPGFLHGAYYEGQSAGYALAGCIQGNRSDCDTFPHTTIPKNAQPYQSFLTSSQN